MADDALDLMDLLGCPYDVFSTEIAFFLLAGDGTFLAETTSLFQNLTAKALLFQEAAYLGTAVVGGYCHKCSMLFHFLCQIGRYYIIALQIYLKGKDEY